MIFPDPFFITLFNEKELYEESFFDLNLIDEEFPFDKIIEKDNECYNNKENKLNNSTIKILKIIQIQKIIYLIFVKRKK